VVNCEFSSGHGDGDGDGDGDGNGDGGHAMCAVAFQIGTLPSAASASKL
jgi:hypothetical protein